MPQIVGRKKEGDIVVSLISVFRLDRDGYFITFGGNKAVVSKNGRPIVMASLGANACLQKVLWRLPYLAVQNLLKI